MKVVVPNESGKILESTYGTVLIGVVPMFETAVREIPKGGKFHADNQHGNAAAEMG